MIDFKIDENWDFEEIVENAKMLKEKYNIFLTSFYFFEIKERNNYIKNVKNKIYNLNIIYWKRDKIWNFLNGDMEYDDLVKLKNL